MALGQPMHAPACRPGLRMRTATRPLLSIAAPRRQPTWARKHCTANGRGTRIVRHAPRGGGDVPKNQSGLCDPSSAATTHAARLSRPAPACQHGAQRVPAPCSANPQDAARRRGRVLVYSGRPSADDERGEDTPSLRAGVAGHAQRLRAAARARRRTGSCVGGSEPASWREQPSWRAAVRHPGGAAAFGRAGAIRPVRRCRPRISSGLAGWPPSTRQRLARLGSAEPPVPKAKIFCSHRGRRRRRR